MVSKECFLNNKRLHFEFNLLIDFVEEVFFKN